MNARNDDVRKWHYLRANHTSGLPSNLLFVDTETIAIPDPACPNTHTQRLRLWYAIACRQRQLKSTSTVGISGVDANEFWDHVDGLTNDRTPLWIFGHNIGFDLTELNFWSQLESGRYLLQSTRNGEPYENSVSPSDRWSGLAVIDDPPTIFKLRVRNSKRVIHIVDTLNYFRCSVADLGKQQNMPKYPMPDAADSDSAWLAYCRRDVEIIHRAIIDLMIFVRRHDLGNWGYTIPSQAFAAFRHRFMKHKILVHGNKDAIEIERDAYYGGRNQILYCGRINSDDELSKEYFGIPRPTGIVARKGPVAVLDIQSCYPSVMTNHLYPTKILEHQKEMSPRELDSWDRDTKCIIASVQLDTSKLFPKRIDKSTYMVYGRFDTTLCGPELDRALKHDAITHIYDCIRYEGRPIFQEYTSTFWELRQQYKDAGNKVYESLCKLFMNSLFGKFGQRNRRWENDPDVYSPIPWGSWSIWNTTRKLATNYRAIAWLTQREKVDGEAANSVAAIAAYVTSYARELVQGYLSICSEKHCYYIDTDSLHVDEVGYNLLESAGVIRDGEIGYLRLVDKYDTAEYRTLKDYTVGDIDVIAGIRQSAIKVGPHSYTQLQFQRLRSILASNPPPGVQTQLVTIDRSNYCVPGKLLSDGTVIPPCIGWD